MTRFLNTFTSERTAVAYLTLFCGLSIVFAAVKALGSFDQYWHIQTGKDLLLHGWSPFSDHYSYTQPNAAISQQPVIFQLFYAALEGLLGFDNSTRLLRLILGLTLLTLVFSFGKQLGAPPSFRAVTLASSTYFLTDRFFPRPELIDQLLIVLGFALAHSIYTQPTHRRMLVGLLFLVAWINFHAGILAYTIFCYPFIQLLVDRLFIHRGGINENPRTSTLNVYWLCAWGLGYLFVGFVNAQGDHPIMYAMEFSDVWRNISEHRNSLNLVEHKPLLVAFWFSSIVVIAWSVLGRRYGLAAVALIIAFATVDRGRMINLGGLSMTCVLLILSVDLSKPDVLKKLRPQLQKSLHVFAWLIASALAGASSSGVLPLHTTSLDARAPADVVARLSQYEEGGRILNEYKWGGYLIYALPRDFQVFIDGRTEILYSPDFYSDYLALGRPDEALLTKLKTDWAPDFAMWSFDQAPHTTLVKALGMQVDFIGKAHLLYKKAEGADASPLTRLATLLKYPMCVTPSDIAQFSTMVAAAQDPSNSNKTLDVLAALGRHNNSEIRDTLADLREQQIAHASIDRVVRLAAHSQLIMGQPSEAADTWAQIGLIATRDLIYGAHALIKAQRYQQAEELISLATSAPWQSFHPLTMAQVTRLETLRVMLNDAGYSRDASAAGAVASINPDSTSSDSAIISPDNIIYTAHCADLTFKEQG